MDVRAVTYAPAGSGTIVIERATAALAKRGLHLVVGRSGRGKSTLLALLAGLAEPTSGTIAIGDAGGSTSAAGRRARVGMVFQFPERHFLGRTALEELTFGWPANARAFATRRTLAVAMNAALRAVGMADVALDTEVRTLSGGYKRRLALAIQLARDPEVLCLDEPLAGLDWRARAEVTAVLNELKRDRCVVVVSHDVEEISPIADAAFRMGPLGRLEDVSDELAGARARAFGAASDEFAAFD